MVAPAFACMVDQFKSKEAFSFLFVQGLAPLRASSKHMHVLTISSGFLTFRWNQTKKRESQESQPLRVQNRIFQTRKSRGSQNGGCAGDQIILVACLPSTAIMSLTVVALLSIPAGYMVWHIGVQEGSLLRRLGQRIRMRRASDRTKSMY